MMTRKRSKEFDRMTSWNGLASQKSMGALCVLFFVWLPHSLPAQGDDPAERARTNAREGLQTALEELQQAAGPDRRITARASILDAYIPHPHLTGVWQSWEIDPTIDPPATGDYSHGRESNFLKWLVSHQDGGATGALNFPYEAPVDAAILLGNGTLGPYMMDARDIVKAAMVPANDPHGRFAWVVLDEGVKVRINTPFKNDGGGGITAEGTMALGSGERPRTEIIDALSNLQEDWFDFDSVTFAGLSDGLNAADFMAGLNQISPGIGNQLKRLSHQVSYHSMGLFCDVARGGLKKDFHLMTNNGGLPAEFADKKVYASQLGLNSEASDPSWRHFADFANLRANKAAGIPFVQADVPDGYTPYASSGTSANPYKAVVGQPQAGTLLLPTIARIQFIFGLFADPLASPVPGGPTHRLNLTYKPIITLHNPYNVALKFDQLKIGLSNLPFAVRFTLNGIDKTSGLRPLDLMSRSLFELTISTASIGGGLQPGEVRIFDANVGIQKDTATGTKRIDMVSGFNPSGGIYRLEKLATSGGYIDFRASDVLGIQMALRAYELWSRNRFVVTMTLIDGRKAGVIEMDYKTPTGIEQSIGGNQSFPTQLDSRYGTSLISYSQVGETWPLALHSFRARTTSVYEETHPGKPRCFSHANTGVARHLFDASHPADHSHGFALQALNSILDASINVDSGRGFFISGETPEYGVSFGSLYDVPLAPIQSFSSLNGADPTGVSGFMPRFAQPIGNSWAHPLITADRLRAPDPEPSAVSDYLDHSFLLNLALYDHFYFSGLADQRGDWFKNPLSTTELAEQFTSGHPRYDSRLLFYRPDGRKSPDFVKLVGENPQNDAYRRVSAWQMMKGAFNVNSTSVEAWKAMLASVHDANAGYLDAESMVIDMLGNKSPGEARISRFRLPGSESYEDTGDRKSYWLGPREYSDSELTGLAEAIVAQVRERGPFLSMGDFVNRRLTSANSAHARCGALQQAIDASEINRDLAWSADAGGNIPQSVIQDNPYYKFPTAAEGASYQGAPGCLSQADLLTVLGNAATVRSDTFTIRAYGESRDASGQVLGRAWCEAVVQRIPDWVDPADAADVPPDQLTSETNRTLGRRFRLVAFRWLQPDEV